MSNGQPEPFYEDMGRKAEWLNELHGTKNAKVLDRRRDKALIHIERMRTARFEGQDPGGGAPDGAASLRGGGRRARLAKTSLPGHVDKGFVTAPVEVRARKGHLNATLKQRLKRGARGKTDPPTARLFRFDEEREAWELIEASGWNKNHRYVWGRITRPGIYAAVALPKERDELERVALHAMARSTIRDAVATGHFARVEDFRDRSLFREYFADRHEIDTTTRTGRKLMTLATQAHRRSLRQLKRAWREEPFGGDPRWLILEDIVVRLPEMRHRLDLDDLLPWWPIFLRVRNRVGPWFRLGPININGRIKSLAMHPTNSDILYAGSANGGVWKTTNGGQHWSYQWKFEDSLAIGSIATAPSNGNVVYAATGEDTPGYGPSYGGAGIYRTANQGSSWNRIGTVADIGERCTKIIVHPTNSSIVFVSSKTGIHRGEPDGSGGYTWTRLLAGRASDLVAKHDDPDVMFAGIRNDGVYKTTDGGASWDRLEGEIVTIFAIIIITKTNFPTGSDAGWIKLAIGQDGEDGSDFLVAKLGPDSARTLISTNAGTSWLASPGSVGVSYDEWCSMVAIHPRQNRHIYLASVGMQHSTDAWTFTPTSGTHADHHQMVFHHTNDNIAYVACDGGVYRTTDNGNTWHLRSKYLVATQLMSLGVSTAGSFLAGCATQDQGIIQTEGSSVWDDHGGGNEWGMYVVDPNDRNHVFISPGGGQLRRSNDGGVTYTNPTSGLRDWWAAQNRNTKAASFAHVAVKPGNGSVVVGAATVKDEEKDAAGNVTDTYSEKHRLYYSSNGGVDWSAAFTLPHRGARVAFAPSSPNRVYAATSQGRVYRSNSSGGSGWTEPATAANRPPSQLITSIRVDPYDRDRVYITYGPANPHIYCSEDAGATWTACAGSNPATQLPDIPLLDLFIDPENSNVLWVASMIGVFRSNDRGGSWYWANDAFGERDLPRVPVTGLGLHPPTHRLYASTMGRGLYYTQATGLPSLRATHVRLAHEHPEPKGILRLRLTDGANTYTMSRLEVIRRIQAGTEVYTVGPEGRRARVRALRPDSVHPQEYLATAPDVTTANNLLSLPRFYS